MFFFALLAFCRHYAALQALALSEEEITWDPEKHDNTKSVQSTELKRKIRDAAELNLGMSDAIAAAFIGVVAAFIDVIVVM